MAMEKRNREVQLKFRVTPSERELVEQRMAQAGTTNMAAYLRKMAIDGYILRLELPELAEMVLLLRRCSNNLNQIAKRVNQTGRVYSVDLQEVTGQLDRLWESASEIMSELAKVK